MRRCGKLLARRLVALYEDIRHLLDFLRRASKCRRQDGMVPPSSIDSPRESHDNQPILERKLLQHDGESAAELLDSFRSICAFFELDTPEEPTTSDVGDVLRIRSVWPCEACSEEI